jgi:thiamine-monophosphate kinase
MKDEEQTREGQQQEVPGSVSLRSEFDFIAYIRGRAAQAESPSPSVIAGIGDDAAVIPQNSGNETVITSDLLVEEIDFLRKTTTPKSLGHKSLGISLSDIAAMGARPRWALTSIGVPLEIWNSSFVDEFYEGFLALADKYGVALIGGDVSRTPDKIVIDSIVVGECASNRAVCRSNAKPGDRLFVTGTLGGASSGLRLIERGARLENVGRADDSQLLHELLLRHLAPEPRVGWGLVLGQEQLATAMIDLSDGLSSDLTHLCRESNVGALVYSDRIPVDPSVSELCGRRALDPLMLALHGGEDFELLFTASPSQVAKLPKKVDGIGITEIGEIKSAQEGIRLCEGQRVWDLKPEGWRHF